MKSMLIGRHNGVGDLVMAIPFIAAYAADYDVTVMTSAGDNQQWLQWLFPGLKVINCDSVPYEDFRVEVPGYDLYLNFNRVELADDLACHLECEPVNQQYHYALLAARLGLPCPVDLSPSHWTRNKRQVKSVRKDVLIFTRSTHATRTLSPEVVAELKRRLPGAVVDPRYPSKVALFAAIGQADYVVASDSGAIHVAEAMGTDALCLHTTMNHAVRHRFYKHVQGIQSSAMSSPCFGHGGCGECKGACAGMFNWGEFPEIFQRHGDGK